MVLAVGDAREIPLADESVQCCITSPPYWGLRDYGLNGRGIGLEASAEEYVAQIVGVFREVRRVLRRDGTVWLNLGDSYASDGGFRKYGSWDQALGRRYNSGRRASGNGLKPKDMVGIPWRVAFALQADGWYLRSDIIWHKPNPVPESVTDRPSKAHEYVFLLAKSRRYYYDQEAVREAVSGTAHARHAEGKDPSLAFKMEEAGSGNRNNPSFQSYMHDLPPEDGRNKRSVWTITTQPYKGAHFATFPVKLVQPMVLAGSAQGDVVLDPFGGTMTVGQVCAKHGRRFVGLDLKREYVELGKARCSDVQMEMALCG